MMLAVTNSQALWYLTRGSGMVSILLLTLVVALGIAQVHGAAGPSRQRFVVTQLHRNASLLVVVFIAIHVATSILDGFAPITWLDAFIPFLSPYRPIWLGLGALGVDLLLALVITSLLRLRIGQPTWRAIHWLAYVCWPIAFLHGLGTGSDGRLGVVQLIDLACLIVVVLAVAWRISRNWQHETTIRAASALVTVILVAGISLWAYNGPMQKGWARKAGTPAELLGTGTATDTGSGTTAGGDPFAQPVTAEVSGQLTQTSTTPGATATITLTGTITNGATGRFVITLTGPVSSGGGLSMRSSTVTMGPDDRPTLYRGTITSLRNTDLTTSLTSDSGAAITAEFRLNISQNNTFTGTLETSG